MSGIPKYLLCCIGVICANISLFAQSGSLMGPSPSFVRSSHIVSTSVFHWYVPTGGQLSGPWAPLEGRENWTGEVDWWKGQIKQMMAANIDVLYVHLLPQIEFVRVNLFQALYEMRAEGYDVPKVAPFLDPLITWYQQPNIDLATTAGKDSLVSQYIRFFNQYFSKNTDPYATDYLARIDERPVLDTWHVFLNMDHVQDFTRADLESRLNHVFGQTYPVFQNGIYMITTALNNPVFSFADERVPQFEINQYYYPFNHNNLNAVQLKGGYWDQNVRNPGDFLPRNGGVDYINAWAQIDSSVIDRVYIESWNEYDEGTGIYAADTMPPFLKPGSGNVQTDVWSSSNDPYEYIKTTYAGASQFNGHPALAARVLQHDFPIQMNPNETATVSVAVRNTGNAKWTDTAGFSFQQSASDPVQFAGSPGNIDDNLHDIPVLEGIFRGRPISFSLLLQAPDTVGLYETHWQMVQNGVPFGDTLTLTIEVSGFPSPIEDPLALPFSLGANHPNPFGELTEISVAVDQYTTSFRLAVLDLQGREVAILAEGAYLPGKYTFFWQAQAFPAGLYLCQLQGNGYRVTRKMILLK